MLSSSSIISFFPPKKSTVRFNIKPAQFLPLEEILESVQSNEACVYWYIGSNGFKQGAVDFYRPTLTQNIMKGAIPFLVDLTAWGAFKNKNPINKYHESAISLDTEKIKTLKCSDFFARLSQIKPEEPVFCLLSDITKRENLLNPSANFSEIGLTLGNLFNNDCPAIQTIFNLDCAKSYSVMQYIEFLFLLEMILLKQPNTNSIRFILPNDEAKYYLSSIEEDIQLFLKARDVNFNELNIHVQCFNYGEQLSHRPYNCPSKTIPSKKKITLSEIIDEAILQNTMSSSSNNIKRFV